MDELEQTIDERLQAIDPEVDLVLLERPAAESLRIYVDHPAGVNFELCERVTEALRDLLEDYSLEVSSPGSDRPLTKPQHFRRYVGRRARVRTREPIGGRSIFTGTLTGADDGAVELDADTGVVSIPYSDINRSNLLEG